MKRIVTGILAHVDAGKTTCIESMLYTSKTIRKLGRVDHQDAYLDYDNQERERGITIYSKEAHFHWKDSEIYLIDTPGHVDFSSEMERSLQVLDLAILLINKACFLVTAVPNVATTFLTPIVYNRIKAKKPSTIIIFS